jgi:hypothetical protein
VFIPENKIEKLSTKINEYLDENTRERVGKDGQIIEGKPKNRSLIESIEAIRTARLQTLWMEPHVPFPNWNEEIWWEVWVSKRDSDNHRNFVNAAEQRARIGARYSEFEDRIVYAVFSTAENINLIRLQTGAIAELKSIKETPTTFLDMEVEEQAEWVSELVARIVLPDENSPRVCLLDTGVNNAHELIAPLLSEDDMHSYHPNWPVTDTAADKHGTGMAGLSIYGDLFYPLQHSNPIDLKHRLESVRVFNPFNNTPEDLYGVISSDAVAQVEIQSPEIKRVFCLAITSGSDGTGKPSEWSATIDKEIFNNGGEGRLFAISAGNVRSHEPIADYKIRNITSPLDDPAQSWNAITVGAWTEKSTITDNDYDGWSPIAEQGEVSPHSRTSSAWEPQWPIKPEVLFEGGNWAASPDNTDWDSTLSCLSLLTTHHSPAQRAFQTINATSAAVAQCSKLTAQLIAENVNIWPETARALIVHGADWTPIMRAQFESLDKAGRMKLLRIYGYGVVDEASVLYSKPQDCTVTFEQTIQPYSQETNSKASMNEMHLIRLPLPYDMLEAIGNEDVRLKLTLSYFVEPNPSQRGNKGRYSYASHGLRFALQRVSEDDDAFTRRVQRLSSEEGDDHWFLGTKARDRGCLISDTWKRPATDLAQRRHIAVYPIGGWWKSRPQLRKANNGARYSLVMSIKSDDSDLDIYTEVLNEIQNLIDLEAEITIQS